MIAALWEIMAGSVLLAGCTYAIGRGVCRPEPLILATVGIFFIGAGILTLLHPETWRITP